MNPMTLLTPLEVLFATGDTMAQQLVEKKGFANQEWARTGRMTLYSGGKYWQAHGR